MNKLLMLSLLVSSLFYSCNPNSEKESLEKWKNEIRETEQKFSRMALDEGIQKAFLTYAAADAVLLRNNKIIFGKTSIRNYFDENKSNDTTVSLTWKPDFVDVAKSGDLGYTYGKYIYSYTDSLGKKVNSEGVFHTVWKRQADNTWRFVWD